HTSAQQGFSTQAVTYAQGRPNYPRQLTGWLADVLRIDAQSTVIDLGAGTGKFTRLLNALAPTLIAVEPVQAMAAQLA
ncbi:class I SAM-dependent methyltransferase, partial [Salmonella enterica subsp. enterica serovar Oranienburg]|nr:class I SAM-dependent methyltransferase [Salmonella enterica subsp. enterica serovar Oranienburg]